MNGDSTTKRDVLRGVYEDNLGIPRSCRGKGRTQSCPGAEIRPPLFGKVGKTAIIGLFALVALLGFNFRIVYLDSFGPLAKQMSEQGAQPTTVASPALPTRPVDSATHDVDLLVGSEFAPIIEAAAETGREYDAMLSHLGTPMADLFDLKVQTIVIDPGHGGSDPGATGHQGLQEKDVALDIARRLRDKLVAAGTYRVLLTREEDRKVYLKERVAFAKENHADLFISIHINSVPAEAGPVNYVETFYFGPHTDQRSLDLAEKENRDSDYVMGDFREIIARIGDTLKTEESAQLAASIHNRLYSNLKRRSGDLMDAGAKTGPFVVLLGVEVPSVLIEVSCISNKAEETRLSTPHYRDSVAGFLEAGIVAYLKRRTIRTKIDGDNKENVAQQER